MQFIEIMLPNLLDAESLVADSEKSLDKILPKKWNEVRDFVV